MHTELVEIGLGIKLSQPAVGEQEWDKISDWSERAGDRERGQGVYTSAVQDGPAQGSTLLGTVKKGDLKRGAGCRRRKPRAMPCSRTPL